MVSSPTKSTKSTRAELVLSTAPHPREPFDHNFASGPFDGEHAVR